MASEPGRSKQPAVEEQQPERLELGQRVRRKIAGEQTGTAETVEGQTGTAEIVEGQTGTAVEEGKSGSGG